MYHARVVYELYMYGEFDFQLRALKIAELSERSRQTLAMAAPNVTPRAPYNISYVTSSLSVCRRPYLTRNLLSPYRSQDDRFDDCMYSSLLLPSAVI